METVKVLGPDGKVVSTWTGADPLLPAAINAIANCVPGSNGGSTSPAGFLSCNTWIQNMVVWWDAPSVNGCVESSPSGCTISSPVPVSNTLTPQDCGSVSTCSGWITEATLGPNTFTGGNCGPNCAIKLITLSDTAGAGFDTLCSTFYSTTDPYCTTSFANIVVSPGDSLLVTIQFTIS